MNAQTQNKLVRYQYEYNEVQGQIAMLQAQLPALQENVNSLYCYTQANPWDKCALQNYRQTVSQVTSINSAISRCQMRLNNLSRQIATEQSRLEAQYQRDVMKQQNAIARQQQSLAKQQQRAMQRQQGYYY